MKKFFKIFFITLLSLVTLTGGAAAAFLLTYQATVSFDFSKPTGEVKKGASGYLYGIAENGVPSAEMVESVDIQTISQKVSGGLQHPVGDIDNADKMLKGVKYEVVYLQDIYDTWYYKHDDIMTLRSKNEYDAQAFLDNDYLPKVEKTVKRMSEKTYKAPIVYCLYNECDNGIWFGESVKDDNPDNKYGVWCDFNDGAKDAFNAAWKKTYNLVKSINKNALIGGPGYCDFDAYELEYFLNFCKENNCLPDVMIYHELAEREAYYFDEHVRDYRALEEKLGIAPLEIIITEYGMMSEIGYPGEMVKYISQIETNKVYADAAYWRLADNLNDTSADGISPNAEWWLMRWYTDMKGETVKGTNKDILSSDFKNYFKYHYDSLSFRDFTGIASTDGGEIDIVCGGGERKSRVQLKKLKKTSLYGKEVEITVEETVYKGLFGAVNKPVIIRRYNETLKNALTVELGKLDPANAYHIVIREAHGFDEAEEERPVRYEFESGKLLKNAYTYDSYCPASGGNNDGHDLVGGMENEGDGVEIKIETGEGDYMLDFVYGNSNDGKWLESGRQDPDGRVNTKVKLSIDGESREIELPNTIKSEYTSCFTLPVYKLKAGEHKIRIEHAEGTCVLDSLLVTPLDSSNGEAFAAVLEDGDRSTKSVKSFLVIAATDGWHRLKTTAQTARTDGAQIAFKNGVAEVYLKRGLNYIDVDSKYDIALTAELKAEEVQREDVKRFEAESLSLSDGAKLNGRFVDGISSQGGSAGLEYSAKKDGRYRLTVEYSNNDEGGVHDYNVDLIERYITVSVNGTDRGNLFCRNTYSWKTVKTASFTVDLKQGENAISLSNNGSERFNGNETYAPQIFSVTVAPVQ
ncbi:MAG: hypothetical protein K6C14_02895 [Eubacterium sp.]|nr:hypothetical protein [Eubacterium sp.]